MITACFQRILSKLVLLVLMISLPVIVGAQTLSTSPSSIVNLDYLAAGGPSSSQVFTVTGSNLIVGSTVAISAPANFEISFDNSVFASALAASPNASGALSQICFVRMKSGLAQSPYSGNISISGGGALTTTYLNISGSCLPTVSVSKTTIIGLDYKVLNGPSEAQSFTVSGNALYANSPISVIAPSSFEVSLDSITFSSSISIPNVSGGLFSAVKVFARLKAGLVQQANTGTMLIGVSEAVAKSISLSGSSAPILSVSNTNIAGLNYILNQGPSVDNYFTVSGLILPAGDIYVSSTTGFEVSLSKTTAYSSSLVIPNPTGGNLSATTIYVRSLAGKSVGSSTGSIDVYTGTIHAPVISVSGAVTPPALNTPIIGSPTIPTSKGFTANWTPVANASGYIVKVYQVGVLRNTYTVADSITSLKISNLLPSTIFNYTVTAKGDNVNYINSLESAFSANTTTLALKSFLLYQTDFTDWVSFDGTNLAYSTDMYYFSGAGEGFFADARPIVNATATVGSFVGYYTSASSSGLLYTKPMKFVNGGIVELTIYSQGTISRTVRLLNATDVMVKEISFPVGTNYSVFNIGSSANPLGTSAGVDNSKLNNWYPGTGVTLRGTGYAKIWYYLPNLTKDQNFSIEGVNGNSVPKNVSIVDFKVYSTVAVEPVVYVNNVNHGGELTIKAPTSAALQTQAIPLGGYNLTKEVQISIEGEDASYFTLSDSVLTSSQVMSNSLVNLYFKPSNYESVKNARLKITSSELPEPFLINLIGVSGMSPKLLISSDSIKCWTQVVASVNHKIKIQAINATNDVTLSIIGSDVLNFSLSKTTVSKFDLLNGIDIDLYYLGNISPIVQSATLKISSVGIGDVLIPIQGITQEEKPKMYNLSFEVSPKGSAIIKTTPAVPQFVEGTKVNVTISPESGYKMYYWSDGKSGALSSRTITVSNIKNGVITAYLKPLEGAVVSDALPLVAFLPQNITTTGFNATWTNLVGASSYTVTVYEGPNVVGSPLVVSANTATIIGLNPGIAYSYKVKANTGEESALVGPFSTTAIITSSCTK